MNLADFLKAEEEFSTISINELCTEINALIDDNSNTVLQEGDTVKDPTEKLSMSRASVVMLSPSDKHFKNLRGKVFGIRNDNPIVEFMLQIMGVPMDGLAIQIRSGFMKYHEPQKMLFIAKYKSDLPS